MPTATTLTFLTASAGAGWNNPGGVNIADASGYAVNESNPSYLTATYDGMVTGVVSGLSVEVKWLAEPAAGGQGANVTDDAELWLSVSRDGGFTWSANKVLTAFGSGYQTDTVGGELDLWGIDFEPADFESDFRIRVRRGTDPSLEFRLIEHIVVKAFSNGATAMPAEVIQDNLKTTIFAVEATPGAAATCTKQYNTFDWTFAPEASMKKIEFTGQKEPEGDRVNSEMTALSLEMASLCYNETPFAFSLAMRKPVSSTIVSGAYRHVLSIASFCRSQPWTQKLQRGSICEEANWETVSHAFLSAISMSLGQEDSTGSASGMARATSDGTTPDAGVNAVYTLTISGTPTGGTYRLRFDGEETSALAYNANAAAIQTALQALSTVGAGSLLVTGSGPFTITAAGALAGRETVAVEVVAVLLTGGTTPTATVTRATKGGYTKVANEPILGSHLKFVFATTLAGLEDSANEVLTAPTFEVDFADRFAAKSYIGAGTQGLSTFSENSLNATVKFMIAATDAAKSAIRGAWRSGSKRFVKIYAVGPNIAATGVAYQMILRACVSFGEPIAITENENDSVLDITASLARDSAWGKSFELEFVNSVASYGS
jgi:hypothetical protein